MPKRCKRHKAGYDAQKQPRQSYGCRSVGFWEHLLLSHCLLRQAILPVCPFRPIGNDALRMKSKMENRYGETKGGKDAFSDSMVVPYKSETPFHCQNTDSAVRIRSCASSPSVVTKRPVPCGGAPHGIFSVYPNAGDVSRGLSWSLPVLDEFRGGESNPISVFFAFYGEDALSTIG